MRFDRVQLPGLGSVPAYSAKSGNWQFLAICDDGQWTVSYRLQEEHIPRGTAVSASSTIMGPFDDFADATAAAGAKLAELRRMA